jgi:putative colanic acid biosysnthesis UDP-glucose lipid carrier transferase
MPSATKKTRPHRFFLRHARRIWWLQRLTDAIFVILLLLAFTAAFGISINRPYWILAGITGLMTPLILKMTGVYDSPDLSQPTSVCPKIFAGWTIITAILFFVGFLTQTTQIFSRILIGVWLVGVPLMLAVLHIQARVWLQKLQASGYNSRRAVIAGTGELGGMLADRIHQTPQLGIQLCGFFTEFPVEMLPKIPYKPLIGTVDELPDYVRRYRIDVVYITLPLQQEQLISKAISELQDTTACVYFVPNVTMFSLMQARTHEIDGIPLISVWEVPFSGIQYLLKRLMDIVVAGGVLLLLSPLLLAIAIAVKCSSPGPILFKQRRYGVSGQEILVYKFRSMRVEENGPVVTQATRNDPRVTKVGAFLRKSSLDELPQFMNVLQGRMSIVGPRPHAVAHNEHYRQLIQGYMLRHLVKPGITGWAQVNGFRGETETLDKMEKRIEYDLEYLRKWSLWLDLMIILRTATVFFRRQNAY